MPAPPALFDATIGGRRVPLLAVAGKNGFLYVLDRVTGAPVHEIVDTPAPASDVPGEQAAPTQPFPVSPVPLVPHRLTPDDAWGLTPWDRASCRERIAALRDEGVFTPPSLKGTLMYPGNAGGSNWGSVAIDPVLDFDPASGVVNDDSVAELLAAAEDEGVTIDWVLETHIHADHLSGAPLIKARTGAKIAIGEHVREVQNIFRPIFGAADVKAEGGDFDRLLTDGERIDVGGLSIEVMHTPGHTPACVTYLVRSAAGLDAFIGDTLFMPDYGSARCDFPGGDAATLHASVRRLLALPPDTRLHLCHDYPPGPRAPQWVTTVAEQRAANIHLHDGVDVASFVAMRQARDATLDVPTLILPSIQVNVRAGQLPPADDNGVAYLRIPLNALPTRG